MAHLHARPARKAKPKLRVAAHACKPLFKETVGKDWRKHAHGECRDLLEATDNAGAKINDDWNGTGKQGSKDTLFN